MRFSPPALSAGCCVARACLAFDPAIRKIIYTTNAIESLNRVIRKSIKTRGSFPTEEAATKLIYLAIRNYENGGKNVREWFAVRNLLVQPAPQPPDHNSGTGATAAGLSFAHPAFEYP